MSTEIDKLKLNRVKQTYFAKLKEKNFSYLDIGYIFAFAVEVLFSALIVYLSLNWQNSYSLKSWLNAFTISFVLVFFIGWVVLMANKNILSPLFYGTKSFFTVLTGQKFGETYFEYCQRWTEKPIKKFYYISNFLIALIHFGIFIVLLIVYYAK